jgi:hypothetical protein
MLEELFHSSYEAVQSRESVCEVKKLMNDYKGAYMVRLVCAIACIALIAMSCNDNQSHVDNADVMTITIAEFNDHAEDHLDHRLAVTGTVSHVCRHGGKKMFIFGEDPEQAMKIDAGANTGSFPMELEGSRVAVRGVVRVLKVDQAFLDEWEAEVLAAHDGEDVTEKENGAGVCASEQKNRAEGNEKHTHAEGDAESEEEDHHSADQALAQIQALRAELAESGKDYLGFYSLECTSYEELTE